MTIVPQGIVPAVHPQGQVDFILCALEPDFVKNVEMELDQKPIVAPFYRRVHLDPAMSGLTKLLSHEAAKGGLSGRLYADQLATALAIRLLFLERQEGRREFCKASALPRHRLRRVIERMRELQSDLDLKTLATESGYSRTHFLRMFRESMGCTPHQYLLRLRLERARELLRQKRMSLIDIAALCGFSSHAHLSRMFRQVVGVPPSEYRRSL
ncbi:helix-turn-helix domain-containing protein [Terriglobus saanensis]|nr:AraC family transcriptional regulator [Terriglobus saanensis]